MSVHPPPMATTMLALTHPETGVVGYQHLTADTSGLVAFGVVLNKDFINALVAHMKTINDVAYEVSLAKILSLLKAAKKKKNSRLPSKGTHRQTNWDKT
jgi:hypothetical protein